MKKIASYSTLFALLLPAAAFGAQSLFYRTGPYNHKPRFERSWLSTARVDVMGGGTKRGYQSNQAIGASGTTLNGTTIGDTTINPNSIVYLNGGDAGNTNFTTNNSGTSSAPLDHSEKTNILNIYGWQNFQFLGANIVGNPSNVYNANLAQLDQLPTNGTFGYVEFLGKFSYIEADIYLAQNLTKGFFLDMVIPIVKVHVNDVGFIDQSTYTGFPNANQAEWQFLLQPANLAATLALYGLTAGDYSKSGVGDIVINAGWTINKEDVADHVDFLDATIKVGVNVPSGFKQNTAQAFSIAAGYNKHVGIPVMFDAAIGFYEWVTLGAHVGGTFFANKTQETRMKTDLAQNGWIKLGLGEAKQNMGNLFEAGAFIEADHFYKGFSLQFGYVYARQSKTTLTPANTNLFPVTIVNSDSQLLGWNSNTVSVRAEYDFAKEGRRFNPNLGIYYSQPVSGKRIFKTMTGGGYLGVNVAWDF